MGAFWETMRWTAIRHECSQEIQRDYRERLLGKDSAKLSSTAGGGPYHLGGARPVEHTSQRTKRNRFDTGRRNLDHTATTFAPGGGPDAMHPV